MGEALTGLGVSAGVAAGPVLRMPPPLRVPERPAASRGGDVEAAAALDALEAVALDLEARAARVTGDASDVLWAQAMMARDPALADVVREQATGGADAVRAVQAAFGSFRDALATAGGYLGARVADLDDLADRAVAAVLGVPVPGVPDPGFPYVLVAHDLAPADTATLDPAVVLAVVTELGGPTSHTAILARSLGVPAVVACPEAAALRDGDPVLVDGSVGTVLVSPDDATSVAALAAERARVAALAGSRGPGRTADGTAVQLLVNVGGARDLEAAVAVDAEGVGLFRTEFLFLDRPTEPGAAEQEAAYAAVFAAFPGRRVVVRTLDAGADKPLAFLSMPDEPNPALGVRGLRTSRRSPDLLERQLAAIAAAAGRAAARVEVMAPMVSTAAEAAEFVQRVHGHGLPVAGAMVEVPAAALRAGDLAAVCGFLSLGTNDLAQYCFAADRMAGELADLLDPWQPALLELVRLTAVAGAGRQIPVGVCGEAAADPLLAPVLVGLGVTSLSMAPSAVAAVRAALSERTITRCRELAGLALRAGDGRSAREAVAGSR